MHFAFTADQEELRRSARRFLETEAPLRRVREAMATDRGYDPDLWQRIGAELGWASLIVPEAYGGAGLGQVELTALVEEMGRALLCSPFFSTVCLGVNALVVAGSETQKQEWLPKLGAGEITTTLALAEETGRWDAEGIATTYRQQGGSYVLDGKKRYVIDGHTSDLLLIVARAEGSRAEAGVAIFAVPAGASGVLRRAVPTMDLTRKLAEVDLLGVRVPKDARLGDAALGDAPVGNRGGWMLVEKILDRAITSLAAEQVGGAERCLEMAVEYAKVRVQFGRAIGSFQAIKHKCADMLVHVESARSAAYYASFAAAHDEAGLASSSALAKAWCSEAFFACAAENIQIHGGIGFTWEHDAHLFFKRAQASAQLFGDASYHRERYARMLGLP